MISSITTNFVASPLFFLQTQEEKQQLTSINTEITPRYIFWVNGLVLLYSTNKCVHVAPIYEAFIICSAFTIFLSACHLHLLFC